MNKLPSESSVMPPKELWSFALVASPPSPLKPPAHAPLLQGLPPATVVMIPVAASTRRTRKLPLSEMNKLPDLSTATAIGVDSCALAAGPPSPAKPPRQKTSGPRCVFRVKHAVEFTTVVMRFGLSCPTAAVASRAMATIKKDAPNSLIAEWYFIVSPED